MRRSSLWVEIGLTLALLTLLVSLLDIGVFMVATREVSDRTAAELAEQGALILAAELAGTPRAGWGAVVDRYRRAGVDGITLYEPTGQVVAGQPLPAPRGLREAIALRQVSSGEDDGTVFAVAPIGASQPVGGARISVARSEVTLPSWGVVSAHAVVSAVGIVAFGLFLFRRSFVGPFERLRARMTEIAAGGFGVSAEADGPREIAEMANALNTMSFALARYREATAEQMARLEAANVELQTAQDALVRSEKLASVGRLAAGLAHELGNPLAAVRGYVELLAAGEVDPETRANWVERTQVEVERMHVLLRNLLDFARLDPRSKGRVAISRLLLSAADSVRPHAGFRDTALEVHVDGEPEVLGDAALLHQVLVNLLLNAADAGARTVALTAHVVASAAAPGPAEGGADRGRAPPSHVVISVQDDGEGIAPEHLPRLFEPFFTTRPPGKGTGLGLAIALRIVDQHGGRLTVRSEPGHGTRFEIVLDAGVVDTL